MTDAGTPTPHAPTPNDRPAGSRAGGSRRWLPILVGVLAVGALVGGVVGLLATDDGGGSSSSNTAVPRVTDATGVTDTTDAGDQSTETSAATAVTEPATSATPAPTTAPATVASTAAPTTTAAELIVDPTNPVRWAEYTGGKVYLQGSVPDQATSDELRDKAAGVVGPDNVLVQYVIDPSAPRPNSAPLFVRDSVLFLPSGVAIDDTARAVLDLGLALMTQNPSVTIDINGYSDGEGDDAENFALSQERVDAIFNYLVFNGIDPARLTRTAHGEADPVADNATAEGRAQNRRVEFTVNNLLG